MRFEHTAGEKLFVDYAGLTMAVINPQTGEAMPAHIFVAALGASNYTYAEATWSEGLRDWIGAHVRALEFFGGSTSVVVPDNTKAAVTASHRYEPDLNRTYADWARHYNCVVIPARAVRPRDKAVVEAAVLGAERWLMAPLRNRTFFSLVELNQALRRQLEDYNNRAFQKLDGSRQSLFAQLDRPALQPLPAERYEFAEWKEATVHIDYHVEVDKHRYSTPYQLVHKKVDVRSTQNTVEIFFKGNRVASHKRSPHKGRFTTLEEHMPKAHRECAQWPPDRLIRWAQKTGEHTEKLVTQILASRPHPQQGFRSCLGILRLATPYSPERLEAACKRALAINALSFKSVESILKHGLDQKPLPTEQPQLPAIEHANVRGSEYYQEHN